MDERSIRHRFLGGSDRKQSDSVAGQGSLDCPFFEVDMQPDAALNNASRIDVLIDLLRINSYTNLRPESSQKGRLILVPL